MGFGPTKKRDVIQTFPESLGPQGESQPSGAHRWAPPSFLFFFFFFLFPFPSSLSFLSLSHSYPSLSLSFLFICGCFPSGGEGGAPAGEGGAATAGAVAGNGGGRLGSMPPGGGRAGGGRGDGARHGRVARAATLRARPGRRGAAGARQRVCRPRRSAGRRPGMAAPWRWLGLGDARQDGSGRVQAGRRLRPGLASAWRRARQGRLRGLVATDSGLR